MLSRRRPMVPIAVAMMAGLYAGHQVGRPVLGLWIGGTAVAIGLGVVIVRRLTVAPSTPRLRPTEDTPHDRGWPGESAPWLSGAIGVSLLVAVFGAAFWTIGVREDHRRAMQERFPRDARVTVIAVGRVVESPYPLAVDPLDPSDNEVRAPNRMPVRPLLTQPPGASSGFLRQATFLLEVERYEGDPTGPWDLDDRGGRETVRVYTQEPWPDLRYGERLRLPLTLTTPPPPRNPGAFDYAAHLRRTGITRLAWWDFTHGADRLDPASVLSSLTPRALAEDVRRRLIHQAHTTLDPADANLLLTVTIGLRGVLDAAFQERFRRTGTVHLLVISGLHVGILALILELALLLVGLSLRSRALLMIAALVVFRELAGGDVAVTRAVVMAVIVYVARLGLRRPDFVQVIATAAVVVLLLEPLDLFHPGFPLSFLATFWLGLIATRWGERLPAEPTSSRAGGFALVLWGARSAAQTMAVSIIVLIGLGPVLLHYFGLVSPAGVLVNVLGLPIMAIILAAAIPLILASMIDTVLGVSSLLTHVVAPLAYLAEAGQALLITLTDRVAKEPWAAWIGAPPAVGWIVAYELALLAIVTRRSLRLTRTWCVVPLLAVVLGYGLRGDIAETFDPPPDPTTRVTLLAERAAQVVLIEAADGTTVLVDPGDGRGALGRWTIAPALTDLGIVHLDAVVLTAATRERADGLRDVLERVRVDRLIVPRANARGAEAAEVALLAREMGVPLVRLGPHGSVAIGRAGRVQVELIGPYDLAPSPDTPGASAPRLPSARRELATAVRVVVDDGPTVVVTRETEARAMHAITRAQAERDGWRAGGVLVAPVHRMDPSARFLLLAAVQPAVVLSSSPTRASDRLSLSSRREILVDMARAIHGLDVPPASVVAWFDTAAVGGALRVQQRPGADAHWQAQRWSAVTGWTAARASPFDEHQETPNRRAAR